jgi:hypothetical protein
VRIILWTGVALTLLMVSGAAYLSFKGDDLDRILSQSKPIVGEAESASDESARPADIVKKFRWKNSAGEWQLTDTAPPGESRVVYVNQRSGVPALPRDDKREDGQQQPLDHNLLEALEHLPELLGHTAEINQQISDRGQPETRVRVGPQ